MESELVEKELVYKDNLTVMERLLSMFLDLVILCFTIIPILLIPFAIGMETDNRWLSGMITPLFFVTI